MARTPLSSIGQTVLMAALTGMLLYGCTSSPGRSVDTHASEAPQTVTLASDVPDTPFPSTSPGPTVAPSPTPSAGPTLSATSSSGEAATVPRQPIGTWQPVSAMPVQRGGFDVFRDRNGEPVVVGSDPMCGKERALAESVLVDMYNPFNPPIDPWFRAAPLNKPRAFAAVVTLRSSDVLLVGGLSAKGTPYASTKIFDASTDSWSSGPTMRTARTHPVAIRLNDGRVLVASHTSKNPPRATSEILDARLTSWSRPVTLPGRILRVDSLTRLGTDQVLALGWGEAAGVTDSTAPVALVYDAPANKWTTIGPGLVGPGLVTLDDGSVLAIGGNDGGELIGVDGSSIAEVRRLSPESLEWTDLAPLPEPREDAAVAPLPDGRILVAGGRRIDNAGGHHRVTMLATTVLYDPVLDSWSPGPELRRPRSGGQTVTLLDGSLMLLGGVASDDACASLTSVERLNGAP